MPRMNNPPPSQGLIKLLLIGDSKIGKSWYAALAAKAGFNVLYINGDVAAQTIGAMVQNGTLTPDEASRIYLLDVGDTIAGGSRDTKFVEFMNEFNSSITVKWNDTLGRIATRRDTNCEVWEIKPGLMDHNTVIVFDSWTAYVESVMLWCGRANGVDVANATTKEMRPVYQGGGLKATETLQIFRSVPCHMIVICHPDEYQHTTAPEGVKAGKVNEGDRVIDWTKRIPKSTSKPHGLLLGKYLTDIGWMELNPAATKRMISFKPSNDRVVGGHFSENKDVEEYSFINLVKAIGGAVPDPAAPTPWLNIVTIGAEPIEAQVKEESKVLDGTTARPAKLGGGLAGLLGKPKAAAGETAAS